MAASVKVGKHFGTTNRLEALRLRVMAGELARQVGANIRQRRLELGMSRQRDLAAKVDPTGAIDNQRISDWERGVNQPSERYMAALSEVLDRPVSWFYEDHASAAPTPDPFARNSDTSQLDRIEAKLDTIHDLLKRLSRRDPAELQRELVDAFEEGAALSPHIGTPAPAQAPAAKPKRRAAS